MLGRRAKPDVGLAEQRKIIASDHGHRAGAAAISSPPKLFLAASSVSGAASSELAEAAAVSATSSATMGHGCHTAGQFSRDRSSGGSRRSKSKSHRPWEARPVGLGLAGALNGVDTAAGAVTTVLTGGQRLGPVTSCRIPGRPAQPSPRRCLSPREMEAAEDYTRVIAGGTNLRTARGVSAGSGEDEFLRYCHGCSKDLGQGKDIYMYRGEMAFCSHDCRYREMLFDENL